MRVVILGRGASGKSSLARTLGELTRLPVIELDKVFWQPGLQPMSSDKWTTVQSQLVQKPGWIMDGDLGPYDAVDTRIREADTIIFLDFPLLTCAWRAIRRSPERADFWRWLLEYRRRSRPTLMQAFSSHAPTTELHVLRSPKAVKRFIREITRAMTPRDR